MIDRHERSEWRKAGVIISCALIRVSGMRGIARVFCGVHASALFSFIYWLLPDRVGSSRASDRHYARGPNEGRSGCIRLCKRIEQ